MRHRNKKNNPTKKPLPPLPCVRQMKVGVTEAAPEESICMDGNRALAPKTGVKGRALSELLPSPDAFSLQRCSPSFALRALRIERKKNNNPKTNAHLFYLFLSNVVAYIIQRRTFPVWLSPETVVIPQAVPSEHQLAEEFVFVFSKSGGKMPVLALVWHQVLKARTDIISNTVHVFRGLCFFLFYFVYSYKGPLCNMWFDL